MQCCWRKRDESVIEFRSDMKVEVVQHMGSDEMIARAARVSTGKDQIEGQKIEGLINYLVKNLHTTPLEHNAITLRFEAPIFVAREFYTHRMFSRNEISGRYAKLPAEFYVPADDRPAVNEGSGAHPDLQPGSKHIQTLAQASMRRVATTAYKAYEEMLDAGIATEVARDVLPVGTYTHWYATNNLHGWLNFLRLRTAPNALYEIRDLANQVDKALYPLFPIAMTAWRTHHGDPSNSTR